MSPEMARVHAAFRVEKAIFEFWIHLHSIGVSPEEFSPEAKEAMVAQQLKLMRGISRGN